MSNPRNHRLRMKILQTEARKRIAEKESRKLQSLAEEVRMTRAKAIVSGWSRVEVIGDKVWGMPPGSSKIRVYTEQWATA